MEKFIYDENNGLWYELQGDYYIPCLKLPDEEQKEIGIWGMRHLEYLKHHRKATYNCLQAEFKLNSYLYDINSQAENLFESQRDQNIPLPFWKNYVVSTFVETIRWWINNNMKESPEILTDYFLKVV